MKKRLSCIILTLVMIISLVPFAAAASDEAIGKMIGLLRLKPLRPNAKAAARRIFRGDDGLPGHGQQPHGRCDCGCGRCCC